MPTIIQPTKSNLQHATQILIDYGNVVFPTETVYGLGGNALSDKAVAHIFKLKNRPLHNPLILHFKSLDRVLEYFILTPSELLLAKTFWPGPLTLILNNLTTKAQSISRFCYGNNTSLGVRVPNNPITLQLLTAVDFPIAAPSANASNQLSPTQANHVQLSLANQDIVIIDGGKTVLGLESTVIKVEKNNTLTVLRYGSLSIDDLTKHGFSVNPPHLHTNPQNVASPGMLSKHYSPKTKLRLNAESIAPNEALLAFGTIPHNLVQAPVIFNLSITGDLKEASNNLFSMLWDLDLLSQQYQPNQPNHPKYFNNIAVMPILNCGLGIAINDRLTRAATK